MARTMLRFARLVCAVPAFATLCAAAPARSVPAPSSGELSIVDFFGLPSIRITGDQRAKRPCLSRSRHSV